MVKLIDIIIRNGQLLIKTYKDDINIIKEQHINVTAEKGKVYLINEDSNKIIQIPVEDKIYIKYINIENKLINIFASSSISF